MHSAGTAHRNAAAEFRATVIQFIAEDPEKRHIFLDIDLMGLTVHVQSHGLGPFGSGVRRWRAMPPLESIFGKFDNQ
jgi:hypothetical protein